MLNQSDGWRTRGQQQDPVSSSVKQEKEEEVLEGELLMTPESEKASNAIERTQSTENIVMSEQVEIDETGIITDDKLDGTSEPDKEDEMS